MVAVLPSGSNTFVKDHDATGRMVVAYSRNPSRFKLNQYIQIRGVAKESGYYLKLGREEAGRVMNTDLSDFVWPDSADRPDRNEGTEEFEFFDYRTTRYDYGFRLGNKAVGQAGWDIMSQHLAIKAQQSMTARTQLAITELDTLGDGTSTGGPTDHTSAVASISGNTGNWGASTTQRQDIKRSINHAIKVIQKASLGVVQPEDLILVMGPDTATEVSEAQEIVDHIKHSDHSLAQVRGEAPGFNNMYGLPDHLYHIPVVIEDAVKVTSHKNATDARQFVLGSGSAYLVSRPGALSADAGGPTFSTLTLFAFEEMTVETKTDADNRRINGHVVDDIDVELTAPVTGFRFTSAV